MPKINMSEEEEATTLYLSLRKALGLNETKKQVALTTAGGANLLGGWIPVSKKKPDCLPGKNDLGTPVLVWPHNNPDKSFPQDVDGQAYYGRRCTGDKVCFFKHGNQLWHVTHWMPLPAGPGETK